MADKKTPLPSIHHPVGYELIMEQVGDLIDDIKLEHIKGLAWKGKFGEAQNLLNGLQKDERLNSRILDLQARIFAQQGHLSEAEATWKTALESDPSNPLYFAGLDRIAKTRSRPYWLKPFLNLITWSLLILFLIGGSLFWVSRIQIIASKNNVESNTLSSQNQVLLDSFALLKATLLEIASGPANTRLPDLAIQVEGLTVQRDNRQLFLLFEEGLFSKGAAFQPHAPELLTKLGQQLEPYGQSISLTIFGLADRVPVSRSSFYRDNNELGRARALKVLDHLRQHSNLSWNKVLVGSLGDNAYPFLDDANENQPKNRTVVIQVHR